MQYPILLILSIAIINYLILTYGRMEADQKAYLMIMVTVTMLWILDPDPIERFTSEKPISGSNPGSVNGETRDHANEANENLAAMYNNGKLTVSNLVVTDTATIGKNLTSPVATIDTLGAKNSVTTGTLAATNITEAGLNASDKYLKWNDSVVMRSNRPYPPTGKGAAYFTPTPDGTGGTRLSIPSWDQLKLWGGIPQNYTWKLQKTVTPT